MDVCSHLVVCSFSTLLCGILVGLAKLKMLDMQKSYLWSCLRLSYVHSHLNMKTWSLKVSITKVKIKRVYSIFFLLLPSQLYGQHRSPFFFLFFFLDPFRIIAVSHFTCYKCRILLYPGSIKCWRSVPLGKRVSNRISSAS